MLACVRGSRRLRRMLSRRIKISLDDIERSPILVSKMVCAVVWPPGRPTTYLFIEKTLLAFAFIVTTHSFGFSRCFLSSLMQCSIERLEVAILYLYWLWSPGRSARPFEPLDLAACVCVCSSRVSSATSPDRNDRNAARYRSPCDEL